MGAETSGVPQEPWAYLHSAVLGPLAPETQFFYLVGDEETGWSPLHQFTTAPAAGRPVRFAATADMGQGTMPIANVARMAEADPAFVLHLGDLSYAEGDPADWDTWFRLIEPVASRAPYMTAIGNHEYERNGGLSSYLERLALPGRETYYSFDCGMLHVVVLDSGKEFGAPPAEMTAWLEADLERTSRRPGPSWTVVGFHFPLFSSGTYGSWEEGRRAWSPLFDRHGVALVLNGHMHAYERSWPVRADGGVPGRDYQHAEAPVYVVTGGAGRHGGLHAFPGPPPDWSAFRASENHTLRVTVDEARMIVDAIRPNVSLLDSFTITRKPPAH